MDIDHEVRAVEGLMNEWHSLRVTEAYRRVHFTLLRDDALARWNESSAHDSTTSHFVEHRVARVESALTEVLELEERSDGSFALCRADMTVVDQLAPRDQTTTIARVRDISSRALREEMRYRTTLLSTLHHEVNELARFIDEKLGPTH